MYPRQKIPIGEGAKKYGPFDLILEGTGNSSVVVRCMQALGKNGVLVLTSVTGGDRKIEVPADRINLDFVLGNKVMVGSVNANREYFELGVRDMSQAEAGIPGLAEQAVDRPGQRLGELSGAIQETDEPKWSDQGVLPSGRVLESVTFSARVVSHLRN